jgi:hypothetical protein
VIFFLFFFIYFYFYFLGQVKLNNKICRKYKQKRNESRNMAVALEIDEPTLLLSVRDGLRYCGSIAIDPSSIFN